MEKNMRDIKVDVNREKSKIFVHMVEEYSESVVRKYILRKKKMVLGELISSGPKIMIFTIPLSSDATEADKYKKAETVDATVKRNSKSRRRTRARKTNKTVEISE